MKRKEWLIKLILSGVLLSTTVLIFVSMLLAWFSNSTEPKVEGVELTITNLSENGFVIQSINKEKYVDDGILVWPNDTFRFDLVSTVNGSNLTVDFSVELNEMFEETVGRAGGELLRGPYQKLTYIEGLGNIFIDFDIDKHFAGSALPATSIHNEKAAFLKQFTNANKIISACTAKVISVKDEPLDTPIPLLRDKETDTVLYPQIPVILDVKESVTVEVTYGNRLLADGKEWFPEMEITSEGLFEATKYRALSLNCFIGQGIIISFKNRDSVLG